MSRDKVKKLAELNKQYSNLEKMIIHYSEELKKIKNASLHNFPVMGVWKNIQTRNLEFLTRLLRIRNSKIREIGSKIQSLKNKIDHEKARSRANHDTKRPPGFCTLSRKDGHKDPFDKWGVTVATLIHYLAAKSVPEHLCDATLAINIGSPRHPCYVSYLMIVGRVIATPLTEIKVGITLNGEVTYRLKWGRYVIRPHKIYKDLVWCVINHPKEDVRDEIELYQTQLKRRLQEIAVFHKIGHYCVREGCKHASNPFIYNPVDNGKPEILQCPDAKCRTPEGCRTYWCLLCRHPHHPMVPCDDEKSRNEWNAIIRKTTEGKDNATACPTCKFLTIKDDQCDHVTCNMVHSGLPCRTEFCFGCGRPFRGKGGIYGDTGVTEYLDHLIYNDDKKRWVCRGKPRL